MHLFSFPVFSMSVMILYIKIVLLLSFQHAYASSGIWESYNNSEYYF